MKISDYIVTCLLDHCGHCPGDKELAMGRKVEKEHTSDPKKAEKIAKDHLKEPGHRRYYSRLKKCGLADELEPPPKADIMPGGSVGGPAGDSTAIGGGGAAGGV